MDASLLTGRFCALPVVEKNSFLYNSPEGVCYLTISVVRSSKGCSCTLYRQVGDTIDRAFRLSVGCFPGFRAGFGLLALPLFSMVGGCFD